MPRSARIKEATAIYHVMARSISEFDLFPDKNDKEEFLDILQTLKEKLQFRIYGYCLMSNHYHIIVDSNGYDISKLMKSLNQRYVKYINKNYKRRGHLLAERFNSKIINSDEYMLTVSAYIHNNSKDLPDYAGRESEYPYSSMGIYIGIHKDKRNLVDTEFVLGYINEDNRERAVKAYTEMVQQKRDIRTNEKLIQYLEEFKNEQIEYRSYRSILLRNKNPQEVITLIAQKLGIDDVNIIMHKWKRSSMEFRKITAYILTTFCGIGINEACRYFNNITASCCARLCNDGYNILKQKYEIKRLLLEI